MLKEKPNGCCHKPQQFEKGALNASRRRLDPPVLRRAHGLVPRHWRAPDLTPRHLRKAELAAAASAQHAAGTTRVAAAPRSGRPVPARRNTQRACSARAPSPVARAAKVHGAAAHFTSAPRAPAGACKKRTTARWRSAPTRVGGGIENYFSMPIFLLERTKHLAADSKFSQVARARA